MCAFVRVGVCICARVHVYVCARSYVRAKFVRVGGACWRQTDLVIAKSENVLVWCLWVHTVCRMDLLPAK